MFEILYNHICLIEVDMAVVVKWLTHQIVALAFVGSIPIDRHIFYFRTVLSFIQSYLLKHKSSFYMLYWIKKSNSQKYHWIKNHIDSYMFIML